MYDEELERKVRKRVKAKAGFMKHFATYCVFVLFFFILNMLTSGLHSMWWYWPALGWGLGVAIHYVNAVGLPGSRNLVDKWESEAERELQRRRGALPPADEDGLDLPDLEKEPRQDYEEEDFV